MQEREALQTIRNTARSYEQALDRARRKQFGQFFSGVPLGKLLVHLSIRTDTRTILDPMAGHGDLLDAAWEVAGERGITLERIDGIEIDNATADMCRHRLGEILGNNDTPASSILAANAFDPATLNALPVRSYDLVVTNPPYVRYQGRNGNGQSTDLTRAGLKGIVDRIYAGTGRTVWDTLVQAYSGLADLSVPAWILAGLLARPGGRLALIVPATWRSRDYADVIRYLLLRFFELETILTDVQSGWFSDALVRTHLIVARRLADEEAREPLNMKKHWSTARWLDVTPNAADGSSLVGSAFPGAHPEAAFAAWLREASTATASGIEVRDFDLCHEWAILQSRISRRRWYTTLEGGSQSLPLFSARSQSIPAVLHDGLRQILPAGVQISEFVTLEGAGIKVGQGLRTGCNGFFYVTGCGNGDADMVRVKASDLLGGSTFAVPSSALKPVLRRQSELVLIGQGSMPSSRVLDLRAWILPEDAQQVAGAKDAYEQRGAPPPKVMPSELAAFVRHAASTLVDGKGGGKPVPQLSAVRSNVREPRGSGTTPRFWYMLPDFTPRHLPAAFVPRINQGTPWIEHNTDPPLLIDANFSTFSAREDNWSPFAIKALLNSVWCRACMEAIGTPLGGGALKLEATHLRKIPIPMFTHHGRAALHAVGKCLRRDTQHVQAQTDRIVLQALFPGNAAETMLSELAVHLALQTDALCAARQRTRHE